MNVVISYFSAGVSSAIATKIAIDKVDRIIYTHIDDQHEDTLRFVKDCEKWFGKEVEIIQSPLRTVDNACCYHSYIRNSRTGAASCTRALKQKLRLLVESSIIGTVTTIWGFDITERDRAERIVEDMPTHDHLFPLISEKINKEYAHMMLKASGIKRPIMYDLGYPNNNCIGCVKGKLGYWNKIRKDFPDVFDSRVELEQKLNACILGKGKWLADLDPDEGHNLKPICEDCGIMCERIKL